MSASPKVRHIIDSQQLTPDFMGELFKRAAWMDAKLKARELSELERILQHRRMFSIFFEPSTRTRFSFESAAELLGMKVRDTENAGEFSSRTKGESDLDMLKVLASYHPDVIVVRHDETDALPAIAKHLSVPIINAGDGRGQHPTQALLDLYTIQAELGRLRDIHVAMVGDLKHGRTARSLAYLLGKYPGITITFVTPSGLEMGEDVQRYLDKHHTTHHESSDLATVLPTVDVVYHTRIQVERIEAEPDALQRRYDAVAGQYQITPRELALMRPNAIVMHPLPRVKAGAIQRFKTPGGSIAINLVPELTLECDIDPRAAYFRQAGNGLPVRMALLQWVVSGEL